MTRNYWLVKQEPEAYSWDTFVNEGRTDWTGVRNFAARKNLRGMKRGDFVFYYHTGDEKQIVGVAKVSREAFPDPTAEEGDWSCVTLEPVKPFGRPVPLAEVKSHPDLKDLALVRQGRLSVMPIDEKAAGKLLALGRVKL